MGQNGLEQFIAEFLVTKDRALLDLARRVAHFRIVAPEAFEEADPSRSLS